ncbi:hypothetical protein [Streptacidiphilus jiangxiensis]|uniref:Uncharacterized protein n=1 Tax=Streptacidiphilus jiangxiensis TaxID=235985 RepID=A0A1H7PPS2_STRJI|nr:hypothetical protein [Streptacidiphilus jiangxiensis]SEL37255.1 hypothetical protein SAMN05414137_10842 [Streptacidiphilus jiangxiensis]
MDETLSPEEALRIAADTRRIAATPGIPAWLPVFAGATMALTLTVLGVSDLVAGAAGQALRIAAVLLGVAHVAVYVELWRRWRRGGLVPLMDSRVRERVTRLSIFAGFASGAGFSMSGHLAWGTISCGLILGAGTWYRMAGQVRQQ